MATDNALLPDGGGNAYKAGSPRRRTGAAERSEEGTATKRSGSRRRHGKHHGRAAAADTGQRPICAKRRWEEGKGAPKKKFFK